MARPVELNENGGRQEEEEEKQAWRPRRQVGNFRKRRRSSIYRGRVCNISSAKAKHRVQVLYPCVKEACTSRTTHIPGRDSVSRGSNEDGAIISAGCLQGSGEVCHCFHGRGRTLQVSEDGAGSTGSLVHGTESSNSHKDSSKVHRSGMRRILNRITMDTRKTLGTKGLVFIAVMALQNMPRISGQAPEGMPVTATELVQEFKSRWMLSSLMIISMILQLVQIGTGGTRKWYRKLQGLCWLAYNTSDAVAVYTLGGLGKLCEERKQVYALWAAILLFHLGGPDNISAYSIADAELWTRHGFQMFFQVITAFYVVLSSADGTILWVSLVLAGVGTCKYAERTLALYHASEYHLDKMARPLYRLMQYDNVCGGSGGEYHYFVLGEKRAYDHVLGNRKWYGQVLEDLWEHKWFNRMLGWLSPPPAVQPVESESSEQAMQRKIREPFGVVMLSDVMDPEFRTQLKHQSAGNGRNVVDICIAFALFKMFRRRLTGLYMHEWGNNKIRTFFNELWTRGYLEDVQDRERLVDVLDMELRFMFDSMFTKSSGTAYTWWGPILRGVFLFAVIECAVVFFRHWNNDLQMAGTVTWVLFVSIVVVEVVQLLRLTLTDWTRVWLTCMFVIGSRQQKKMLLLPFHSLPVSKKVGATISSFVFKVMAKVSIALLSVVNFRLFGHLRRGYWRHRFGQVSLIPVREEEFDDRRTVPKEKVRAFKVFLLQKVFQRCELLGKVRKPKEKNKRAVDELWNRQKLKDTMASVAGYTLTKHQGQALIAKFAGASTTDLENAIITWHVATCLCEANEINRRPEYQQMGLFQILYHELKDVLLGSSSPDTRGKAAAQDKEMSQYMSRYTLYLLKERTQLLPSNAALAKEVYQRTKRELRQLLGATQEDTSSNAAQGTPASRMLLNKHGRNREIFSETLESNAHQPWKAGRVLADRLIDHFNSASKRGEMWELLADVWADLLITIAVAAKPKEHVELLTEGGEFITHIWVLLGHMGFGAGPNLGNMGRDAATANS